MSKVIEKIILYSNEQEKIDIIGELLKEEFGG